MTKRATLPEKSMIKVSNLGVDAVKKKPLEQGRSVRFREINKFLDKKKVNFA